MEEGINSSDKPQSKGFFQTIPGIITGTAALITAVGGLILTLNQTGCFGARKVNHGGAGKNAVSIDDGRTKSDTGEEKVEKRGVNSTVANISANKISYSPSIVNYSIKNLSFLVKEATIEPLPGNQQLFKLKIKCTNESSYRFNFGTWTIRVKIDEDKYVPDDSSPSQSLQTVDAQSFRIYEFYFKIPSDAKSFTALYYDDKEQIGSTMFTIN